MTPESLRKELRYWRNPFRPKGPIQIFLWDVDQPIICEKPEGVVLSPSGTQLRLRLEDGVIKTIEAREIEAIEHMT